MSIVDHRSTSARAGDRSITFPVDVNVVSHFAVDVFTKITTTHSMFGS